MPKADTHIKRKFVPTQGAMIATLAWVVDDSTYVPITDEEAEILRGLDSYYVD